MNLKSKIYTLLLVLTLLVGMSACSSDSDDSSTSASDQCYISSFSLGTLKRTMYGGTNGDSAYTVTFSATLFPMTIDQRNLTVENRDSLPYGTRTSAALATISYTGTIGYQKEGADTTWYSYSSSDSIDFSTPLKFTVASNDGLSYRRYRVKLNVHQTDGSKFSWVKVDSTDALSGLTERKAIALEKQLVLMGKKADGSIVCATCSLTGETWNVASTDAPSVSDLQSLCLSPDEKRLLMSTTTGAIWQSEDGRAWTVLAQGMDGLQLLGTSSTTLYALQGGNLMSSSDEGKTWDYEICEAAPSHMPAQNLNFVRCTQENGYTRLVLVGQATAAEDGRCEVWSKAWHNAADECNAEWMYYNHTADNGWLLPEMSPLFVMPYADGLVAMGGKTSSNEALSQMLYSADYGLTWKTNDELYTNTAMQGLTDPMTAVVDKNNFIWLMVGNQTWRGRLNRLGFASEL